jgi:hypothetical protein
MAFRDLDFLRKNVFGLAAAIWIYMVGNVPPKTSMPHLKTACTVGIHPTNAISESRIF